MDERFLANVGHALIFKGNEFVGHASTLTENTFSFSATPNEVRGGKSNPLLGRWFSDSTLNVTLTNATFKLEHLAWTLGTTIEQGGTAVYESSAAGETVVGAGQIELANKPAAFNGTMIGWYKKPADATWSVASITQTGDAYYMSISGAKIGDVYCVKYLYMDENARMMSIPADFNPDELHVVIINDLYNADINVDSSASVVGRLITDIPRLGLDPSQDLTLNATSSAPTQISGTAFRYSNSETCADEAIYGTMTEQIYGSKWQDNVAYIVAENSEMELTSDSTETIIMRVVFNNNVASQRKDNSNFTFTKVEGNVSVSSDGVVTGAEGGGTISVTLTDYPNVPPAYVFVLTA